MSNVTLIVWQDKRKLQYDMPSHQEAVKMARNMFAGMRIKIVDKNQRHFHKDMKSYSDMMAERYAY